MLKNLFEPYRRAEGAWDWYVVTIVSSMLRSGNMDALVIAIIVIVMVAIIAVNLWFLYHTGRYLWNLYLRRGMDKSPKARALQAILAGWFVVWVTSIALFRQGEISQAIFIDTLGITFFLIAFGITQIDRDPPVKQPRQLTEGKAPNTAARIKDFISFKRK